MAVKFEDIKNKAVGDGKVCWNWNGDGSDIVTITPPKTMDEFEEIANGVINSVFLNDEYVPTLTETVLVSLVLKNCSDIDFENKGNGLDLVEFVHNYINNDETDLIEVLMGCKWFKNLVVIVKEKIDFKKQEIIAKKRNATDELIANLATNLNDLIEKALPIMETIGDGEKFSLKNIVESFSKK